MKKYIMLFLYIVCLFLFTECMVFGQNSWNDAVDGKNTSLFTESEQSKVQAKAGTENVPAQQTTDIKNIVGSDLRAIEPTGGNTNQQELKTTSTTKADPEDNTVRGIKIGPKCLKNGQCSFSIYQFLGIRTSISGEGKDPANAGLFIQDIILSATFFIGTVVTIALIVSGLLYIFAAASGKEPTKAAAGVKNSFIGLILVISSYAIIRLVQYLAAGK